MNTTQSTVGTGDEISRSRYVSCIKVDGVPILPPLMTDERRAEMRRYKELAILKEKRLQEKSCALNVTKTIQKEKETDGDKRNGTSDQAILRRSRSRSTSPSPEDPITSTPRIPRVHSVICNAENKKSPSSVLNFEIGQSMSPPSPFQAVSKNQSVLSTSSVPEGVLRERKVIIDLNKSQSSEPSVQSSSTFSYDGDEEKREVYPGNQSDDNDSVENFVSAPSSTGTFVIRKSDEADNNNKFGNNSGRRSKELIGQTFTTSEEEDDEKDSPPTVVRKPCEEPIFSRRKRPAKFFDDDVRDGSGTPKTSSSAGYSHLPNSVPEDEDNGRLSAKSGTTKLSFSPVPRTNFTSIAKSLTNEFTQKVCVTLAMSSQTGVPPSRQQSVNSGRTGNPSLVKDTIDIDCLSNSSDKENINTLGDMDPKKHVRKLSYTLAAPSAALLEAVSKDTNFTQTLDTIASEPSVQSGQPTPEKQLQATIDSNTTIKQTDEPSLLFQDVPKQGDPGLTSALANLNLGHGKQAHLERFLGDNKSQIKRSLFPSPTVEDDQLQSILRRMQEEQTRKLQELAEQHRRQELLIKQEFESELERLKEKISSTLNTTNSSKNFKTSPNSILDSINTSARSPVRPPTTASVSGGSVVTLSPEEITRNTDNSSKIVTSGMSGISFSEQTKSGVGINSVYQFRGDNVSVAKTTKVSVGSAGATDLAGVGLSKLQSRMLLMSPSIFRTPVDPKSPLLKGLVFPDPLEKPRPPIRIPQKALDPMMKPKFDQISAAVKGYLTRRVLHAEKVQIIVQTIRDTVDLLMKLYEEAPMSEYAPSVKPQDQELHQRLIQQLTGACRSFHDVFFKLTTKERMAIIATDREKLRAKALRHPNSPGRPNISNATLKSIERRMSHRSSPKRDTRRQRISKANDPALYGSMSVKAKPIKSFNISPKRRRISYWDERNTVSRSSTYVAKPDVNGNNNLKTPNSSSRGTITTSLSARSQRSAHVGLAGGIGDTFIIPSSAPSRKGIYGSSGHLNARSTYEPMSGRRNSTSSTSAKTISARSTQSTISASSTNSRSSRTSITNQKPWK